jgi:hypothetical protein
MIKRMLWSSFREKKFFSHILKINAFTLQDLCLIFSLHYYLSVHLESLSYHCFKKQLL